MEKSEKIISIAFEGMHRVGKGTHIEALKEKLAKSGIPCVDIRGEGSRPGKGEEARDPRSEWWLKINEALRKKEGKEDATKWDEAAYRLARELIVWRDRFLARQIKEAQVPSGVLIIDRSLLSRAAFIKQRMQHPPEKIFSSEDLYPSGIQRRKKISIDMVLPDLIIELVAPKEVLIGRLDPDDPKYDFRKRNIEDMYDTYMDAKSHLSREIQERIVTFDASNDQEAVFNEIENIIKQRFPELLTLTEAALNEDVSSEKNRNDDEGAQKEKIDVFLEETIGGVENIEPVSGGLVHRVFRVKSQNAVYYLKVRGDQFAGMPTVESVPSDIRHEEKALRLMSSVAPDTFPHVVASKQDEGMLLITSVMKPEDNFLARLRAQTITEEDLGSMGKALRDIHDKLDPIEEAIRDDGDEQYYKNNLLYRLGSQQNETLNNTIQELSMRERKLIFGDLSPKNLGLVSGQLRICDLDASHRGNSIFDVGFFIGHLYVHGLEREYPVSKFTEEFLKAYQFTEYAEGASDDALLKRIVLGTLLYRLHNKIVPYPIDITDREKLNTSSEITRLLNQDQIDWEIIEQRIQYAKSH